LRLSPSKSRIIVYTPPELHARFYRLKRHAEREQRRRMNNTSFLTLLLDTYESVVKAEEARKKLVVY
jgi:hypothetical protein